MPNFLRSSSLTGFNSFNERDVPARDYLVTIPPRALAVSLEDFKDFIKITNSNQDEELKLILRAVIRYGEQWTKRDFITRTYECFLTDFPGTVGNIELRKSRLQSVVSVEYLVDSILTTVATSVFYNTTQIDYSVIAVFDGQQWPSNADRRLQAVKITFTAGFGARDSFVPEDIRSAILQHGKAIYELGLGCDEGECAGVLPKSARMIYNSNKILDIVV